METFFGHNPVSGGLLCNGRDWTATEFELVEEDERAEEWRVDAEEILLISAHNSHNLVRSLALVSGHVWSSNGVELLNPLLNHIHRLLFGSIGELDCG